jgi:hypothetical protein
VTDRAPSIAPFRPGTLAGLVTGAVVGHPERLPTTMTGPAAQRRVHRTVVFDPTA